MPEPSILDARLAEIDRRLKTIQSGLAPAPEAAEPSESPESPESPESAEPPSSFPAPALVPSPDSPDSVEQSGPAEPTRSPSPPEPAGAAPHPRPAPDAPALMAELRGLVAAQERWLASARELLAADDLAPAAGQPRRPAAAAVTGPVGVSAGPFASTEALRRFERALSSLPDVREVVLREYAGGDRVVIDVHLFGPIS
jgi:hypothetical protein